VNIALEEKRKEAESGWMNRINNAPRVPLLAAAGILVVAISSLLFFTHRNGNLNGNLASASIVSNTPTVKAPESKINATVIQTAEVKKDSIQIQPTVKVQESALVQNTSVVKNDVVVKNTGVNIANKPIQASSVIAQKDDNKPILIQHDVTNTQIIPNDQPASKGGVAVDLGSSDNSSSHPTAEMGAIEDTTAQQ
jgi:hypothetical protein